MLGPAPGILAWGLVTGVAMAKSDLGIAGSALVSLTAYAGSAQLATLPLFLDGAGWWLILVTAIVINLRFTVYSAALNRPFAGTTRWHRLALGYAIGDVTFVRYMAYLETQANNPHRVAWYWGAVSGNWLVWQVGSLAGIFAASRIPDAWSLQFAGILALIAVMVPALVGRPALLGAAVAGIVSVLARGLPLRLGVLVALLAGIAAAMLANREVRR